ncbi:hypothetical protein FNBNMHLP_03967 [Aeromonas jandaei]
MVSGSRSLDSCIQRQKIGLFGNAVDHFDNIADAVALGRQRTHQCRNPFHFTHQLSDRLIGMTCQTISLLYIKIGLIGRRRGFHCITCYFLHSLAHLGDSRCNLIKFGLLGIATTAGISRQIVTPLCRLQNPDRQLVNLRHHLLQLGNKVVDVDSKRPHLILTVDFQTLGQVTISLGQIEHGFIHLIERSQHIAMHQNHQQGDDTDIKHHNLPNSGNQLLPQVCLNSGIAGMHQQAGYRRFLAAVVINQIMTTVCADISGDCTDRCNRTNFIPRKTGYQLVLADHQQGIQHVGSQLGLERCLDK